MTRAKSTTLTGLLVVAFLSGAGCTDKKQQQIQLLTDRNSGLLTERRELRGQLARATTRNNELLTQLNAQELEVESLKAERKTLSDLAATRTEPLTATESDWKSGTLGDEISLGSDVLFSPGRASLLPAGKRTLNRIATDLRTTYAGTSIRIYGYTDSDPIRKSKRLWRDNLDLSANRAMAVSRYLITKGIKPSTIETIAMGRTHPMADNRTRAGKKKNRRVEIVVLRRSSRRAR